LSANSTGASNTAIGYQAGYSNISNQNTFVGSGAGYITTGINNVGVGYRTFYSGSGGAGGQNTAVGNYSLYVNDTGSYNTALGMQSLFSNTTASYNTAVGYQSLQANITGTYQVALGYRSGYNATASYSVYIGQGAGYSHSTSSENNGSVFIGNGSGGIAGGLTGHDNTYIGANSGSAMTSGSKNTILGQYTGNQGGLDIRTSSNNIVLSDGDGNPRFNYVSAYKAWQIPYLGGTSTGRGGNTILSMNSGAVAYDGSIAITDAVANNVWWGLLNGNAYVMTNTLGVNLSSGATSWASASDSRLKNVTGTYLTALSDIAQIDVVKFTWKSDEKAKPCVGVIAQSVQGVVPEAVDEFTENNEQYLSVRYTELIPLLIASIQELSAEVTALKQKVGA